MKRLFILASLLLFTVSLQAQEVYNSSGRSNSSRSKQKNNGFDPNRIIFGGGISLGFGDVTTIGAAPILGYRITDRFSAGIGIGYLYYKIKYYNEVYNPVVGGYETYPLKSTLFYPSVWTRFLITQNFFAQAEFEYDFQTYKYYDYDGNPSSPTVNQPVQYTEKINTKALLLGGGFRQPITSNTSLIAMVLYDVLQEEFSPYKNRIEFRIGVSVGF